MSRIESLRLDKLLVINGRLSHHRKTTAEHPGAGTPSRPQVVKPGTSSKGSGVVCLLAKDYVLGLQDQFLDVEV